MNLPQIKKALGHRLIGTNYLKNIVCRALQFLPENTIRFVTKHCWFVGSFTDGWAFTLKGNELKKDECLIFLSDELMSQDESQIRWTIIHEVGHVILGHRNSIGEVQSKSEIRKQEKEADDFARKYLG